ncbi:hypothetical protein [Clostridium lundense]|uniref:hypothetical protein n=1 Tax=Clostridium lundense TaxID=319475 RepID=UPI000488C4FC|nr:hypothetical protein [Clostridium lundense]
MDEKKQCQLEELADELEIILSVKNVISKEEINNFIQKFNYLSEHDIRLKISEVTKDNSYISNIEDTQQFILPSNLEYEYNQHMDTTQDENNSNVDEINSNDYEKIESKQVNDIECEEDLINPVIQLEKKKTYSFDENNIPEVSFIRGEIKYGQLSLEWGWPEEVDEVFICYKMDMFPKGPRDLAAVQYEIKRHGDEKVGSYIINKVSGGDFYFYVYTKVNFENKTCYSKGQKRLVVNREPSEIFYEIKIKRSIFGKLKSSEIMLWTKEKEMNLPQLIVVGKVGNMPLQKSDGGTILNIDCEVISKDNSMVIELPNDNIRGNMYVKLFFFDDANSKLFRIVSPAKERLYFK